MTSTCRVYSKSDFCGIRKSGALAAHILDYIAPFVQNGITTDELNSICHSEIIKHEAIPAPLNYCGYPKSVCISVNEVVCHGIPSSRSLKNGDIVNIDVTVILDGWFGDSSRMYLVGDVDKKALKLVDVTYQAMMLGIEIVKPGIRLGDIGATIEKFVKGYKYSVVRNYCGHGIGRSFHESPEVRNYTDYSQNITLCAGNVFTVEPMINIGDHRNILLSDEWTVVTIDKSLSAQFEHTIGVTDTGYEIFTMSKKGFNKPPYEEKN